MAPSDTDSVSSCVTCGKKTPRSEVVFLCQVLILYTVIVVNIYNLTVKSENSTLWTPCWAVVWDTCYLTPWSRPSMFYLTLPTSNSSMNYCPNNTLTHYTTKLQKIMDLDRAWKIGLTENRTGGRKRRRNDHPSVWSDTVLSPVTKTISDRGNRFKGRHGLYSAIRKRTSGGDTSL